MPQLDFEQIRGCISHLQTKFDSLRLDATFNLSCTDGLLALYDDVDGGLSGGVVSAQVVGRSPSSLQFPTPFWD